MKRLAMSAALLAAFGGGLVSTAAPAAAGTAHCPDHQSSAKVELDGDQTSVSVPAGSTVCYKAGNEVATTVVGDDGILTSEIYNRNGEAKGISYYIVIHTPPTGS